MTRPYEVKFTQEVTISADTLKEFVAAVQQMYEDIEAGCNVADDDVQLVGLTLNGQEVSCVPTLH